MEMNDPLRREEKKESTPDRQDSGPSTPDVNRPGRDDLLKRMIIPNYRGYRVRESRRGRNGAGRVEPHREVLASDCFSPR